MVLGHIWKAPYVSTRISVLPLAVVRGESEVGRESESQ